MIVTWSREVKAAGQEYNSFDTQISNGIHITSFHFFCARLELKSVSNLSVFLP
jgi:hypothetical protein